MRVHDLPLAADVASSRELIQFREAFSVKRCHLHASARSDARISSASRIPTSAADITSERAERMSEVRALIVDDSSVMRKIVERRCARQAWIRW